MQLDNITKINVDRWLNGAYDQETKETIRKLLKANSKEIIDSFYTNLTFGTAGMRGLMGVGTNRLNIYTIRQATQALANYIHTQPAINGRYGVFIGYDSRHNSKLFAEEASKVLAANKIEVYLCKDIRPTPLVSFGCRFKRCIAAIMITASHNPPEYNGYKVYWSDGGQVLPPHDKGIIEAFNLITDLSMILTLPSLDSSFIEMIDHEVDEAYLNAIQKLQCYPEKNHEYGKKLSVVYTSLHGTGITLMPKACEKWGFTNLQFVEEQIIPDGDFPTAHFPNPEYKEALSLGIKKLTNTQSDILIATDPDADRVGVVVLHNKEPYIFDGNQIATLCLYHICKALSSQNALSEKAAFIKTIVTTELFQAIADSFNRPCFNVLTGFKYIAEKIREWEQEPDGFKYIFGGEESYGYLLGTETRDKDAVVSGVLLCEVALYAKEEGKTLVDLLHEIYKRYGVYFEKVLSLNFEESKEGKELMQLKMHSLRENPITSINEVPVIAFEDYMKSIKIDFTSKKIEEILLPKADVLVFWLENGTKLMVRPSGTEPKIKLYCGVINKEEKDLNKALQLAKQSADSFLIEMKKNLTL